MTTTFSSGKIKGMMPSLTKISRDFIEVIGEAADAKKCLNFRDYSARYMCEIIGDVAFGLECKLDYKINLNVKRNVSISCRQCIT